MSRAVLEHPRLVALRPGLLRFAPVLAVLALQLVVFPVPAGVFLRGAVVGGLTALVALGMALVYRANRVVSFAQADLGGPPTVLVFMLISAWGWSWYVSVLAGLAASLVLGALVELAVVRRFRNSPRLLLTVATIGLAQLLAAGAALLPRLWGGTRLIAPRIDPPFQLSVEVDPLVFTANDLIAAAVVPLACLGLWAFLTRTSYGIAVRASAERAERAALLGVPVGRLGTLVWVVAGGFAFLATFLRAGVLGLPFGVALSLGVLLRALAALVLGRLSDLPVVAAAAVALGVLELGIGWNTERPGLVDPVLAAVVIGALVLRRRPLGRAEASGVSTWRDADEVRPIPPALARLPEVRAARIAGAALVLGALVALPHLLATDRNLKGSAVLIYGILGLSLVVLTGWSGQLSLGAVAFFAVGAVAGSVATDTWGLDLTLALPIAAVAAGATAAVVGLPALRLRGFYLAVTTLAFALAAAYVLDPRNSDWVPAGRIDRPPLLGRVSLDSPTRIWYLSLGVLLVVLVALRGIRRSRTGRVLLALRENEAAATSYGISPLRATLTAFSLAGAVAGIAGCLFVHHQQAIDPGPYEAFQNLVVLTMVVIGGIASLPGALLGALFLQGSGWLLPTEWQPVASGVGVLVVLLVLPGGLGGLFASVRDLWLGWVARRHGLDERTAALSSHESLSGSNDTGSPDVEPDPVLVGQP